MIQESIVYCYKYKTMDIIDSSQLHIALETCEKLFEEILIITQKIHNNNNLNK